MDNGKSLRRLDPPALSKMAAYGGARTVLLDHTSRIVYELGSRSALGIHSEPVSSIGRRIAAFVHPDDMLLAVDKMEQSLSTAGWGLPLRSGPGRRTSVGARPSRRSHR